MSYKVLILLVGMTHLGSCGNGFLKKDLPPLIESSTIFKDSVDGPNSNRLIMSSIEDLTSLEWTGTKGKKQVITKEDGQWHYAGMEKVDPTAFATYLSSLVNVQGSEFSEYSSAEGLTLVEKLTLYGNNMVPPTIISAYKNSDTAKSWLIQSSDNSDAFFLSDSSGIYKRIFSDLTDFWP